MSLPDFALLAAAVSALVVCILYSRQLTVPPGPKGSLLTGALRLLPTSEAWRHYWSWSEDFASSIISFRVYGTRIVVLNDVDSVTELLGKRADIYSDRPRNSMFTDICGRKNSVFNISSLDERHKQYRKLLHTGLNPLVVRNYWPIMQTEVSTLLDGLACPEIFVQHIRRYSTAIIMKLAYGYSVTEDDRFIKVAEESNKISGMAMAPGRWLVNHYPILRFIPAWFPGAGWKRQGLAWRQELKSLSDVPHEWVKQQMANGKFEPSFTSRHLQERVTGLPPVEHDDIVKWCAGGLYAGATDTTISALISFVLLMAVNPEVQAKAQRELDETFSRGSSPQPAELGKLPYLNAVFKEVMRFAPVANLGLPHKVIQDDEYSGYFLPKGSTIIANVWAIMHDSKIYPDPYAFSPERFLSSTPLSKAAPYDQPQTDPRKFAFGFGQRRCPGIAFTETMVLLAMASVVAKYEITLPPGNPKPSIEFTSGITSHIKPFEICFKPRSEEPT